MKSLEIVVLTGRIIMVRGEGASEMGRGWRGLTWEISKISCTRPKGLCKDLVPRACSLASTKGNSSGFEINHENNCTGQQNSWIIVAFANTGKHR